MKAAVLAIALVCSCFLAVNAGPGRRLAQAPSSDTEPTVFDVADENGLNTLLQALTLDDLQSSLDNTTRYPLEYTVFAPTDEAFAAALASLDTTLAELDQEGLLDDILQYHFIIQPYTEAELNSLGTVQTNFRNQTLTIDDGVITAFGSSANITVANVQAGRTIVHVIDAVLVPDFDAVAPPASAPAASA